MRIRSAWWMAVTWTMVLAAMRSPAEAAPVPGSSFRVTTLVGGYFKPYTEPAIASHGGLVVMLRDRGGIGMDQSLDGGRTWGATGFFEYGADEGYNEGPRSICVDDSGYFYQAAKRFQTGYPSGPRGFTIGVRRGRYVDTTVVWEPVVLAIPPISSSPSYVDIEFPEIAWDSTSGNLYLTYAENLQRTGSVYLEEGIAKIVRSTDRGQTWSAPLALGGNFAGEVKPALGPEGEVYVIWQDFAAHRIVGRKSMDQGVSFGPEFVVGAVVENLYRPLGHDLGGTTPMGHPDLPRAPRHVTVAVDGTDGPNRGRLYVAWTEAAEGAALPIAADVWENEPNETLETAMPIEIGQHVFAGKVGIPKVLGDTDWYRFEGAAGTVVQLSGRVENGRWGVGLECGTPPNLMIIGTQITHASPINPPYLYTLPVTGTYYVDGGRAASTFSYDFELREYAVASGSVARDHRDVVMAWSGDGGTTWAPKLRVNDDPPYYENSMPVIAVDSEGRLHALWYDRREAPQECGATVHTYWSYSDDGGVTFHPSVRLSSEVADLRDVLASRPGFHYPWTVGGRMALAAIGDRVQAFWPQPDISLDESPQGDIHSSIIEDDGITEAEGPLLRAFALAGRVQLWWKMRPAAGVVGFRVHRAEGSSEAYAPLRDGALIAADAGGEYEFEDESASPGLRYRYQLEVVSAEGSRWYGPVEAMVPVAAARVEWRGGAPNPFGDTIALRLGVPREAEGTVVVYDVQGHVVRRLQRGRLAAGELALRWDGRDGAGRRMAAGVYLVRAAVGGETRTLRVVKFE